MRGGGKGRGKRDDSILTHYTVSMWTSVKMIKSYGPSAAEWVRNCVSVSFLSG